MTSPGDLQAQADALHWYHSSIWATAWSRADSAQDEGNGILPDVTGRSVLDIGAWDGKYSFQAERAGASARGPRPLRLGRRLRRPGAYWAECIEAGVLPDQSRDETDFW